MENRHFIRFGDTIVNTNYIIKIEKINLQSTTRPNGIKCLIPHTDPVYEFYDNSYERDRRFEVLEADLVNY